MQRYFIEDEMIRDGTVIIKGSDHHHIKRVMRYKQGDEIIIHTYEGKAYLSQIVAFNKENVVLNITKEMKVPDVEYHLDLGMVLTKKDAFELALKKATELGVTGFIPLISKYSIIKIKDYDKKKNRYLSICKESAEQSERFHLPTIHDLLTIEDINTNGYDYCFFGYARENGHHILHALKNIKSSDKTLFLIGPEGGFSNEEYKELMKKGFKPVSLGKTILRAETAAIFVASSYRLLVGGEG